MRVDDAAELLHGIGYAEAVELCALEIPNEAAAHADVVVVVVEVRIEPDAIAPGSERRDEPEIVELPQRSVDGVERHGRHSALDCTENGFHVRVLLSRHQLPEDLEALMGQLDAGLPGDRLDVLEPMLVAGLL